MITGVDRAMTKVVGALETALMWKHTLLWFLSVSEGCYLHCYLKCKAPVVLDRTTFTVLPSQCWGVCLTFTKHA
jgi:hypothetical protein